MTRLMVALSSMTHRPSRLGRQPRLAAGLRELAHAQNIALPLGDRDHTARIEQIEYVTGLDALVISWQRHQMMHGIADRTPACIKIFSASCFSHFELLEQHAGVGVLEIVP